MTHFIKSHFSRSSVYLMPIFLTNFFLSLLFSSNQRAGLKIWDRTNERSSLKFLIVCAYVKGSESQIFYSQTHRL